MLAGLFSIGLLAGSAAAVARTSPPSGAKVVSKSGGQYTTIQAAVNSISKSSSATTTIFVQPGTYKEQVIITGYAGPIRIYGSTPEDQDYNRNQVILTNSLSSSAAGTNAKSGTIRVESSDVSLYNIRVENTAGDVGPAHALTARGNRLGFYGCAFIGYQDTVFVDVGPMVFKNSYIEGATDYIYGNANIWVQQSVIGYARNHGGFITASGRDSNDAGWYVINDSEVRAAPGFNVPANSVYLGRPWRAYARVVFQKTALSNIIIKSGWDTWGKDVTNVYYAEFGNRGDGAKTGERVSWARQLTKELSIQNTIPGWQNWADQKYWNNSG